MKLKHILFASLLTVFLSPAIAQETPPGFVKGAVTLADGSLVSGLIKDNLKKSASVQFIDGKGVKKTYRAYDVNGISIGETQYSCISGDFFKMLSVGKMNFLQKASNASGNLTYNGTEAIASSGTDGKIGDYFVYANNQLKLLNKKSLESFINTDLSICTPAVEKAREINGDIARLQEAVEIFNKN